MNVWSKLLTALRGGAKFDDAIKKVQSTWGGKLPAGGHSPSR